MQFLITQGLGSVGDGSGNATLVTQGLGTSGAPSIPACLALRVLHVQTFSTHLLATFSNNLVVSGPGLDPGHYVISGPTNVVATKIEVVTPGHLLKISVTEQQTGGSYTLKFPTQGIMDVNGNLINGPFEVEFTGIGIPTTVQIAKSIDQRTLEVVFNEAVLEEDAIIPSKYTITPALKVEKVERITDFHYRLTTGPQEIGQSYQVEISGIRDIHGNS
jgi:hypothetical protein